MGRVGEGSPWFILTPVLVSDSRQPDKPQNAKIVTSGDLKIQDEDVSYDFGTGAGFYVDATKEPWSGGYRMYSYITDELPKALFSHFTQLDADRVSITGHSMGGHGALTLVSSREARMLVELAHELQRAKYPQTDL